MKRVFAGGALVALIAILIAPAVYADDPPGPPDSPQARIGIPPGVAAQNYAEDPPGPPDPPEARIRIPTGVAGHQEPASVFELFWGWLQARMRPPIG